MKERHKRTYNTNNIFIFQTEQRANADLTDNKQQRDLNSTLANGIHPAR
jgi:hypothetical protein